MRAAIALVLMLALFGLDARGQDGGLSPPLRFDTSRERAYWEALSRCTTQLDEAHRWLEAREDQARTTSVACALRCPDVPACPPCEACSLVHDLVLGGLSAGGGIVAGFLLAGRCPNVEVIR